MSVVNFLKRTYITHFSKPAGRRTAYRHVYRRAPRSVVLLGLGELEFVEKLIWLAQEASGDTLISLTGVDLFEMRDDPGAMPLKQAHQRLAATGVKVKLAPGDPFSALARNANSLTDTDLLIVAAHVDPESLQRAWFYVPRMLNEQSLVLQQQGAGDEESYQPIGLAEVARLAEENAPRRRAA